MNLNKISIVILAGGLGTRLRNFRGSNTDKILLQINGVPMITKQIEQVVNWGFNIENIVCVTNPYIDGSIKEVTKNKFGSGIKYVIQPEPLGIAHAFSFAEDQISSKQILLVLGDNFFENHPIQKKEWISQNTSSIFVKDVPNPEDFGVAEILDNRIVSLEEKPKKPKSNLAVVGLYLYESNIFNKIKKLKPSGRGELEITDLNKKLMEENVLSYYEIDGWWIDAGTPERIIELESKGD